MMAAQLNVRVAAIRTRLAIIRASVHYCVANMNLPRRLGQGGGEPVDLTRKRTRNLNPDWGDANDPGPGSGRTRMDPTPASIFLFLASSRNALPGPGPTVVSKFSGQRNSSQRNSGSQAA